MIIELNEKQLEKVVGGVVWCVCMPGNGWMAKADASQCGECCLIPGVQQYAAVPSQIPSSVVDSGQVVGGNRFQLRGQKGIYNAQIQQCPNPQYEATVNHIMGGMASMAVSA